MTIDPEQVLSSEGYYLCRAHPGKIHWAIPHYVWLTALVYLPVVFWSAMAGAAASSYWVGQGVFWSWALLWLRATRGVCVHGWQEP